MQSIYQAFIPIIFLIVFFNILLAILKEIKKALRNSSKRRNSQYYSSDYKPELSSQEKSDMPSNTQYYSHNYFRPKLCSDKYFTDERGYLRFQNSGMLLHRYIASKKIGRRPYRYEEVHHIDGDKRNNRMNNLQVLTHQEHQAIHDNNTYKFRPFF